MRSDAILVLTLSLCWQSPHLSAATIRPETPPELSRLTAKATDIVIGTVLPSEFSVTPASERSAEQLLKVEVVRSIKGRLPIGAIVTVGRPAKRASVGDPAKGTRHLGTQLRYLLFLRRATDRNGYAVVDGPAGTFEVRGDKAIPYDRRPASGEWRQVDFLPLQQMLTATGRGR
jgi:hypothetical protein